MIRPDERTRIHYALTRALEENGGQLPRKVATVLSRTFNVSVSQLRREVATLRAQSAVAAQSVAVVDTVEQTLDQTQPRVSDEVMARLAPWWCDAERSATVLAELGANATVAAAWKRLRQQGVVPVSYPTFTRQLKKHLEPAVHASLTAHGNAKGRHAYLDSSLYCTEVTEGRNTRWQADVQYVPVRIRSSTGTGVEDVFQITFIDEATRVVTGTMFTLTRPTGADVAATLASAIAGWTDDDGNFYGGLPSEIRWDRGGEFLNEVMTQLCAQLVAQGQDRAVPSHDAAAQLLHLRRLHPGPQDLYRAAALARRG